mgnify:FL=1
MRTSGLLFTHCPDGSASLGYEDYGVEIFGGADYEVPYLLDTANLNKLLNCLGTSMDKNTKNVLIEKFGERFDSNQFEQFCQSHEIVFG